MSKTTNYEIFKDIHGNRKINKGHVSKLVEAIERKNLLEYFPILCNEDMEVIDGQHRLSAAMRLQTTIWYAIVPGLQIEDVMSINTNSKSWTMMDFINSWIVLDKPDYQVLLTYLETYKMNPSVAASILSGYTKFKSSGSDISKSIKSGDFKVASLHYAEKIATQLQALSKYTDDNLNPMKDREFIGCMMRLNANKHFDFDYLMSKLKLHDLSIEKRPSEKYYIILMEELYNFNNKKRKVELYVSSYERLN